MVEEVSLLDIYEKALKSDYIVLDCETNDLNFIKNDLWLLGIGSKEWCYVLQREEMTPLFWEMLNELFRTKKIVGHNIKADLHVLTRFGITEQSVEIADIEDTMLMSQLIDENGRHDLQSLTFQYYKHERTEPRMKEMMEEFQKGNVEPLISHCLRDIMDTAILWSDLAEELIKLELLKAYDVEKELLKVLLDMEKRGVLLDYKYLEEYNGLLAKDLEEISKEFPEGMNLISPKQVGEYLFTTLSLPSALKTPKGANATSEEAFKLLKSPIADRILYYRTLSHTKSTFVEPYLEQMDKNFRLHCSYRQLGARTGRLSCVAPDLQAVLKDEKVRKIFVGAKNFLCADYSQMEAIVYSNRTGDKPLQEVFKRGDDVYAGFASTIFNLTLDQIKLDCPFQPGTSYRDFCKGIFLGMMYGMGEAKFKRMTGEDIYPVLIEKFPVLVETQKKYIRIIQQQGAAKTLLGRYRRLLPHDAYKGINADIQGSSRDILAIVMTTLPKSLRKRMVISVHDELDFEDIEENEVKMIAECMKNFDFAVPLRVKIGVGPNWWVASKEGVIK